MPWPFSPAFSSFGLVKKTRASKRHNPGRPGTSKGSGYGPYENAHTVNSTTQPPKCRHCGKAKGAHKAKTLACPQGQKTSIGYCHYSTTTTYTPRKK